MAAPAGAAAAEARVGESVEIGLILRHPRSVCPGDGGPAGEVAARSVSPEVRLLALPAGTVHKLDEVA